MDILTKKQNFRLWQSGAFGNKLRAWRTLEEWQASGFFGNVVIRNLGVGGGPCVYGVTWDFVSFKMGELEWQGANLADLMINEMAPGDTMVLQGEYLNGIRIIDGQPTHGIFLHSRAKGQMRDALRLAPQTSQGLRSDLLIKEAMTPASYEDWQELLTQYPDHVLEVSIYDHCLGDLPHRNAVVWEVRKF